MQILVFRSYGDLIILLQVLNNRTVEHPIQLMVSTHLKPLLESLPNLNLSSNITLRYFDIGIDKGILRLFTNKNFFSLQTIKEIIKLKRICNRKSVFYVEQKVRCWALNFLFYPTSFLPIVKKGNVYKSYFNFFSMIDLNENPETKGIKKVLLFPDSRKSSKQLPLEVVKDIINNNQKKIIVAKFGNGIDHEETKYYNDFPTLIQLIQDADFIISADSLPVHLAQYLNKPHYILYAKKINFNWLSPFAQSKQSYGLFNNYENLSVNLV